MVPTPGIASAGQPCGSSGTLGRVPLPVTSRSLGAESPPK